MGPTFRLFEQEVIPENISSFDRLWRKKARLLTRILSERRETDRQNMTANLIHLSICLLSRRETETSIVPSMILKS
jgi:hypothetical protein